MLFFLSTTSKHYYSVFNSTIFYYHFQGVLGKTNLTSIQGCQYIALKDFKLYI